jgi:hypothetical protein
MTRKQALAMAAQVLSERGQDEAAAILHKLSTELPFYSWSEDAIRDAVEQFILDHGRVPTATDFKKRGLPPHTVIKKRFGITLQEWLNRDYPVVKLSEEEKRTKATEAFVRDYFRIQPKSADEFNARRARPGRIAGTPSPSATTPAAGGSCCASWGCRSTTPSMFRA